MSDRYAQLFGEDDAPAIHAVVDALIGRHPERGGPELDQAAYEVVKAVKKVLYDSRPDTHEHIGKVRTYLSRFVTKLLARADAHDASKLEPPELEVFNEFTPLLQTLDYGSDEYKAALAGMSEGLEHHFALNPHHPEHHEKGVRGMTLVDVVEMLCDWKAASERVRRPTPAAAGRPDAPAYGDSFLESIRLNQKRWGFSDELADILTNTAIEMWGLSPADVIGERGSA